MTTVFSKYKASICIYDQPGPSFDYNFSREGANAAFNEWGITENQTVSTIIVPSPYDPVLAGTVGMSGCGYLGLVLGADGKLYSAPWEEQSNILVIDPTTDTATGVSFGVSQPRYNLIYNGSNFLTGALAPNGKIYFPPFNTDIGILVIDPATQTSYNIPQTYYQQHYGAAVLGPNGLIYCMGRMDCLIIDPSNDTYITTDFGGVVPTFNGSTPEIGGRWLSGVKCIADDKLYFVSRSADYLIVIDTSTSYYGTAERKTFGSSAFADGQKFSGIANGQNGLLHLVPGQTLGPGPVFGQRSWVTINPIAGTSTTSNIAAITGDAQISWGATTGDDAGIYSAPFTGTGASSTYQYLYWRNGSIQRSSFNLSFPTVPIDPEWYGGCMAPNGKIYSLPHMRYYGPTDPTHNNIYAKAALVLDPGGNAVVEMGNTKFRDLVQNSYFNKGGS